MASSNPSEILSHLNGVNSKSRTSSFCVDPAANPSKFKSLITQINDRISSRDTFFSFEYFPPRTANGAANLINKMINMNKGHPLFCDITWHPAGEPMSDKPTASMMIANTMLNYCGIETMLHITCCNSTTENLKQALEKAKLCGIRNILALRGDPPLGKKWKTVDGGLSNGGQFVNFINEHFPNTFTICVAGYPTGHPEAGSYDEDLRHLKEKVDAGAHFVITQLFFKASQFLKFVADCRAIGISCPIIPGVLPIQAYASLKHIVALSQQSVPEDIMDKLEPIKTNDEAIRQFGIDFATDMCKQLLQSGLVSGLHFYTLNRDFATVEIVKRLGLWTPDCHRSLPWRPTANVTRAQKEEVRPIFWSNNCRSYIYRTSDWEEFPNGRWGNSSAATFGDHAHHLFYVRSLPDTKALLDQWGHSLQSEHDVWKVFVSYLSCMESGDGVTQLPFTDNVTPLDTETRIICAELVEINQAGFLTINSQPNASCVPSEDEVFGWGPKNGYVFQKAYLEFFTPACRLPFLLEVLNRPEYCERVNFHMVDRTGSLDTTNHESQEPIAVTWGVFPGKEVVQPTVVEPISFRLWRDEVYSSWRDVWAKLYPKSSFSRVTLEFCLNNYILVNLIDNQFPKENCLFTLVNQVLQLERDTEGENYDASLTVDRITACLSHPPPAIHRSSSTNSSLSNQSTCDHHTTTTTKTN